MARRTRPRPAARSRLSRRRRRRLVGALVGTVGTVVAAAGGWLFAAGRPAGPPAPRPAAASPSASAPPFRLAPDTGDLQVSGGRLDVPVVDSVELLPSCHK